ncbi:tetratricopeptide repeat protein [Candidatus Sumerlaeota bacterium]|nr:tetratricopeptide repeat protein [Candidatus Sumerlaeota bacterium]
MTRFRTTTIWVLALCLALSWTGCRKKTPEDLLEEGRIAHQNSDFMGATVKYRRVIELAPDTPEADRARFLLADLLLKNQDSRGAYDLLRVVSKRNGLASDLGQIAFVRSMLILENAKQFDEAIGELLATSSTLVVAQSPEEAAKILAEKPGAQVASPEFATRLALMLGEMYRSAGDEAKAVAQFESIRDTCADESVAIQAMDHLVGKLVNDRKVEEAIAIYSGYLENRPESEMKPMIMYGIGYFYNLMSREDTDETAKEAHRKAALEALNESLRLFEEKIEAEVDEDKKADAVMQKAIVYQELRDSEKAEALLQKHIASVASPSARSKMMLFLAQNVCFERGDYDKALELCRQIATEYPDSSIAVQAHDTIALIDQTKRMEAERKAAEEATTTSLESSEGLSTSAETAATSQTARAVEDEN